MCSITILLALSSIYAEPVTQSDDVYKDLDQLKLQIRKMKREMSGLMKEITDTYPDSTKDFTEGWGQDIKVDVTQSDSQVLVRADLPGMDKDKIEVTLEQGRMLKIAGSRDVTKNRASPGVVMQERSRGAFSRTIELPVECKPDGIRASYANGVLDVSIPKRTDAKPDTVKVRVQ
jgi:HSP20 family protein